MVRERRKNYLGITRRLVLAIVVGEGILAFADIALADIRVAIPMASQVESRDTMSWRDASGDRGSGTSFALGKLSYPVRVRGKGEASSGKRAFPLPAEIIRHNGSAYVVLELDMTAYLSGVLPHEMNVNWPGEALKAQAVLARTFAARRRAERREANAPFDIIAGTVDQEYRWEQNPSSRIRQLVRATDNEMMRTDNGKVAQIFYHSCSGGMTADASEIWNNSVPGIVPVKDPNDTLCPDFFWSLQLSPEELGGVFSMRPVVEIKITARGPSGRVTEILLNDDAQRRHIAGQAFRRAVGASRIKSTLFEVRVAEIEGTPVWMFQGSGSGHGVGLSQFGARALAEEGRSYREILAFYFPRLKLDR